MNFESAQPPKRNIPKIVNERLLIKGGKVVNYDLAFQADIFIENGIIRQIGNDLIIPGGVTTIDARNAIVIPGGIDVSTNFDSSPNFDGDSTQSSIQTVDNFYTGTRAALLGGTTTIMDFVSGENGKLISAFKERTEASSTGCCDVSFHVDVTKWNDDVKQSMTTLAKDHGVNSFRVYMSDKWQLDDSQLYEVFEHIKLLGGIALVHAENGSLIKKKSLSLKEKGVTHPEGILSSRSEEFELEAINRAIIIAHEVVCPLFFWNVTGERAIQRINQARSSGQPVYGQALAHAVVQDGSVYRQQAWKDAAACLTWPPLRDNILAPQRILEALGSGNLQCVSSGHCVYTDSSKSLLGKSDFTKIPPGTNGVFERMMVLWTRGVNTGCIDQHQFVSLTSTNAAKIFNLFPQKGYIAVGSHADIVVWSETGQFQISDAAAKLHVTKPDCSNAFEGLEVCGGPSTVICHGKVVFNDNQVNVIQSLGKLIDRPLSSPHIYERLRLQARYYESKSNAVCGTNQPLSTPVYNGSLKNMQVGAIEKPERFTRSSGHRAMHQSGWSFSGEQVGDSIKQKNSKYSNPPGGLSHISLN